MENALKFLKENKNLIKTNDLNQLVENDDYNDLDDEFKNDIFYMASFFMSTKEYKTLKEAIEDFEMIIEFINNNDYLYNEHECFEEVLNSYLNNIDDLMKPCFKKNQEDFIKYFHQFFENLEKIHFHNDNCKKSVVNILNNIQDSLTFFTKKIKVE